MVGWAGMINYELMLVITTLAGSAGFGIWRISLRLLSRYEVTGLICHMFRVILAIFLFPAVYLALLTAAYSDGGWSGAVVAESPFFYIGGKIFRCIWCLGALWTACRYGSLLLKEHRKRRGCRKVGTADGRTDQNRVSGSEDQAVILLGMVCREMGIRCRVELYRGTESCSPMIGGIIRPRLYIGEGERDERKLRIVFLHELTHLIHGDLWVRAVLLFLGFLYWFNPLFFTGWIFEENRRWSEDYCDHAVCRKIREPEYIRTLLYTAITCVETGRYAGVQMCENGSDVRRRVLYIENRKNRKLVKPGMAAVCMALYLLIGGTVVMAAGEGVAQVYGCICYATEVAEEEKEEKTVDDFVEHEEASGEEDPDIVEEEGEMMGRSDGGGTFAWDIEPKSRKVSAEIEMAAKGEITITALADLSDNPVRVGVIKPDRTRIYIVGTDAVTHTFAVDKKGAYKIYAENRSGAMVNIIGVYQK